MSYLALLSGIAALTASWWLGRTPLLVPALYAAFSLLTLLFYARDKSAARSHAWRIPENTLHLLALAGGWPGALLAQQLLRHKTSKTSFRVVFWLTVLANSAGFVWLHLDRGTAYLNEFLFGAEALVLAAPADAGWREMLLRLLGYRA